MSVQKWDLETNEYREFMGDTHAWECPLCGQIHHGDTRPDECAVCLAPGHAFKEVWPKKYIPTGESPRTGDEKVFSRETGKDEEQWNRCTKSWRSLAHPKPA